MIDELNRIETDTDEKAMVVLGDERLQDLLAQLGKTAKRPRLIRTHNAGIADYVSGKDGGQPPFHTLSPSIGRLAIIARTEGLKIRSTLGTWTPGRSGCNNGSEIAPPTLDHPRDRPI
jgi:hypothetical protein